MFHLQVLQYLIQQVVLLFSLIHTRLVQSHHVFIKCIRHQRLIRDATTTSSFVDHILTTQVHILHGVRLLQLELPYRDRVERILEHKETPIHNHTTFKYTISA